ncbi:anti-sigma factor [Peribacillus kribbensis]|uniref:anti-sigma factor n=1 Tax=Peribacillus kribbensis TaxID=356658 RepID=UPI0003F4F92F|nr:anti-sigma factor [Peribacillus kribbensis]
MAELCDTLIDYLNGHLSPAEKQQFEEHLKTCSECRAELELWNSVSEDLIFQSEPVSPPEGMKERVLAGIFGEEEKTENENLIPLPKKTHRRKGWMMPAMAAALLISLGANVYLLNTDKKPSPSETASPSVGKVENYISLQPVKSQATGTASILKQNGRLSIVVQASQLNELRDKEVYQVWLIKENKPYRAGTFVSTGKGEGTVVFQLSKDMLKNWDTIAITLEPNADSQTPKGSMVLASHL